MMKDVAVPIVLRVLELNVAPRKLVSAVGRHSHVDVTVVTEGCAALRGECDRAGDLPLPRTMVRPSPAAMGVA